MLVKGIIFDFDGVIADTEFLHRQAWVYLAQEVERDLPNGFLDSGIGSTNGKLFAELFHYWNGQISLETIKSLKTKEFKSLLSGHQFLIPGVKEALAWFQREGFPMGLATSSPNYEIQDFLVENQFPNFLSSILTLDDVQDPKPHPEVYLKTAENLRLQPKDCLVFEDSVIGITAAQKAGCKVIAITSSHTAEQLPQTLSYMTDFHQLDQTIRDLKVGGYEFQP